MADKPRTPQEEAFSRKFVECNNASEAYRCAYDVGENTKPETIWTSAFKTLAKPHVSKRVFDLQSQAVERTLVTIESITIELEEARYLGKTEKQAAAMTAASMGKAKVNGLLVDKQEHKHDLSDPMQELLGYVAGNGKRVGDS